MNLVADHLSDNEEVAPERLCESPFTDNTPHGPHGLVIKAELDDWPNAIGRNRRAFGLEPHRTKTFDLSNKSK